MGYTVSVQMSGDVNQAHNRRDEGAVERANQRDADRGLQAHIDVQGRNECWVDKTPMQALHEVMDAPLAVYNANQKRKDRRKSVEDVVARYKGLSKTPMVREIILEIGNKSNHPEDAECRRILHRQLQVFRQENPNMVIVGAYYHNDEPGSAPHLHLDYIPTHTKKQRGVPIQIGMAGALEDLGYNNDAGFATAKDRKEGAMAQWSKDLHERMHQVAQDMGLETIKGVTPPKAEERDIHEPTLEHKVRVLEEKVEELEEKRDKLQELNHASVQEIQLMGLQAEEREAESIKKVAQAKAEVAKITAQRDAIVAQMDALSDTQAQKVAQMEKVIATLDSQAKALKVEYQAISDAAYAGVIDNYNAYKEYNQVRDKAKAVGKEITSATNELDSLKTGMPKGHPTPRNRKMSKGVEDLGRQATSIAKIAVDAIVDTVDEYER